MSDYLSILGREVQVELRREAQVDYWIQPYCDVRDVPNIDTTHPNPVLTSLLKQSSMEDKKPDWQIRTQVSDLQNINGNWVSAKDHEKLHKFLSLLLLAVFITGVVCAVALFPGASAFVVVVGETM